MTNTDVTKMAFFAPDPKLITIDLAAHEKRMTQLRAERDAANPPRSEGPAEELRKLRNQFFCLTERAKSTETYCNNLAGNVKLLEERINETLKLKKAATDVGNLRGERTYENAIVRLEVERDEVDLQFNRARRVSAEAATALKEWPFRERVKELEKIVG
jgi:hypothetical protein